MQRDIQCTSGSEPQLRVSRHSLLISVCFVPVPLLRTRGLKRHKTVAFKRLSQPILSSYAGTFSGAPENIGNENGLRLLLPFAGSGFP